jgi:formylglycine-generating enzyme required for sulfatase activity
VNEVTQAQFTAVMGRNPSYFRVGYDTEDSSRRPVDSVSWEDAQVFVARLNKLEQTHVYRLPTEVEWEWAARAGQESSGPWGVFFFGNERSGVFRQSGRDSTAVARSMPPNAWGLHDMAGTHVLKGGSFMRDAYMSFPGDHAGGPGNVIDVGFRVIRVSE